MKMPCGIIRDLLPLYYEGMASAETIALIDAHILDCEGCKAELDKLKPIEDNVKQSADTAPLNKIKDKIKRKKIISMVGAVLLSLMLAFVYFNYLALPIPLEYSEDLFTFTEAEDGRVLYSINQPVAGCTGEGFKKTDKQGGYTYTITAWRTKINKMLKTESEISGGEIIPVSDGSISVYYSPNNGTENILIYGPPDSTLEQSISMPRLFLTYYFIIAFVAALIVAGLCAMLSHKNKAAMRVCIKILYLPCSYLLAHLIVCGVNPASYYATSIFYKIIMLSLFIYIICICGEWLIKKRLNECN